MFLLDSDELLEHTSGIIHEDTQQHDLHLDLTVSEVQRFTEAGSLDFGGGEFEAAATNRIDPVKQSKEDDYGWWLLKEGTYRAIFNESLQNLQDMLIAVAPHAHSLEAGIVANTQIMTAEQDLDELSMIFEAPKPGCNIKENARFATLHLIAE